MEIVLVGVVVALGVIWLSVRELRSRVLDLQRQRFADRETIDALARRVAGLEGGSRGADARSATAPPTAVSAPAVTSASVLEAPAVAPALAAARAPAPAVARGAALAAAPAPAQAPAPAPARAPAAARAALEWETVVGANWLNRLGVLVFVIGIALFVGYSMTNLGPGGRVLIGYLVSLAMLGSGVVLERRTTLRRYAYGLLAGGWAGTYFTTYAMRAVPAAQVLDDDVVATLALVAVAAGMIGHSLRYRSQTVTALAFLVAYATLALTPLAGFALVSVLLLATSLLVVSHRLGWHGVSILGVVATYAVFALRARSVTAGGETALLSSSVALAAYWLTFEAADIAALARARRAGVAAGTIFPLNAVGFLFASVAHLPATDTTLLASYFALTAGAYLASAIVRARLLSAAGQDAGPDAARPFTTVHAGVALATALTFLSIDLAFHGGRQSMLFVLGAEMLFVSGMRLRDRHYLALAIAGALVATGHVLGTGIESFLAAGEPGVDAWTGVALVAVLAWTANREWLQRVEPGPARRDALWIVSATLIAILVAFRELDIYAEGLALQLIGAALVAAGMRRRPDALATGFVTGAFGIWWTTAYFAVGAPPPIAEAWLPAVVPLAAALLMGTMAAVLAQQPAERRGLHAGAAFAAAASAAFVALFERHVLPAHLVAAAWAATGLVAMIAAAGRRGMVSWLGAALGLIATLRVLGQVLDQRVLAGREVAGAAVALGLAYAIAMLARDRIRDARAAGRKADEAEALRVTYAALATLTLTALVVQEVPADWLTPALGLEGALLLTAGFFRRDQVHRVSGLLLLLGTVVKVFFVDLASLRPLARIAACIVLGLVLLGVSWVYSVRRSSNASGMADR